MVEGPARQALGGGGGEGVVRRRDVSGEGEGGGRGGC